MKSNELVQLLGANTATKLCGSLASSDVARFASYMQGDPKFLLAQQPRKTFAAFVRGKTERAVSLAFPYIDLAKEPRMTEAEWRDMRARNRQRYGVDVVVKPTHDPVVTTAPRTHKGSEQSPEPSTVSTQDRPHPANESSRESVPRDGDDSRHIKPTPE